MPYVCETPEKPVDWMGLEASRVTYCDLALLHERVRDLTARYIVSQDPTPCGGASSELGGSLTLCTAPGLHSPDVMLL
jgi:hypothetical protein